MPDSRLAKRVLLVGWDAGDWQIAQPLMVAGLMPTLRDFVDGGVWGNLGTLEPILSPMLWNSIATGKSPDQHGICGFTEPLPDGSGIRPVSSRSRKCKALWNILTQNQMRSHVVGWYASHPSEPILGTMVSNQFEHAVGQYDQPWPIPDGSIYPESERERLGELRVHPAEIDASAVLPFVPGAAEANESQQKRISKLRSMLAQTASIHHVATELLAADDWDFAAVYYEGIDRFGHEFMEFHPPQMASVDQADFAMFKHVMAGIYRFHDMMLQTLMKIAGPDTIVILMSDHGYYNNHLRPDPATAGPMSWHRPIGMMAMHGPGIKRGERVFGANILDATPTVLRLLGLPVGADMPGRAWVEAMQTPMEPHRIMSWEAVDGDDGRHPDDVAEDPASAKEALRQLIELGYVSPPDADVEKSVADTLASNQICLATSMMSQNRHADALSIYEALPESHRDSPSSRIQRALCHLARGEYPQARTLAELVQAQEPDDPRAELVLGMLAASTGDLDAARRYCTRAAERDIKSTAAQYRLARVCLLSGDPAAAEPVLKRVLELDPDHANAHDALAQTALALGRDDDAIDYALRAIELRFQFPAAHLHLGKALHRTGQLEPAIKALQLAIKQRAGHFPEAHAELSNVLEASGQPRQANEHRLLARADAFTD